MALMGTADHAVSLRGHLLTERRNSRSRQLDRLALEDMFDVINAEDATVPGVVAAAKADVCRAVELVVEAWRGGGRLLYVGAGTSGRLGVLDAAECPPTFLSSPTMVVGVIAGGDDALKRSVEGAEDCIEDGAEAMRGRGVGPADVVFGISTGGTTPYVHGALAEARRGGARTVFLSCVDRAQVSDDADVSIRLLTGPEVVTGSTRMKAGTATKLVLNMVTTMAMVRLGKVYDNLMVDVDTSLNAKLLDRGTRLVQELVGGDYPEARKLLQDAGGQVKTAVVMRRRGIGPEEARRFLQRHLGDLRAALEEPVERLLGG